MRPPFIDAHVHFWDRERLRYPWLSPPAADAGSALAAIAPTYLLDDYLDEARDWNVAGLVHVEAGAHEDDAEAETAWLQSVADARGPPNGLVVQVRLDDADLPRKLGAHAERRCVRGVRHIVNWRSGSLGGDPTADDAWRRGYGLLEAFGFSFDFHGFAAQLARVAALAERHPGVTLVLNHLALPDPTAPDEVTSWRAGLTAVARLPHAAIKLSGAGMLRRPLDPAIVRPFALEAIDRFGPSRVLVASNFPTDRMAGSLNDTLGLYEVLLAAFSLHEQRDMWGRNADRIYRLGLDV